MKTTLQKANASKEVSARITAPASPSTMATLRKHAKGQGLPLNIVVEVALDSFAAQIEAGKTKVIRNF